MDNLVFVFPGLSMNNLHVGDKWPVQRGVFKISMGNFIARPNVSGWAV